MRVALLAAAVSLVAGIVTWNVVFDRAIDAAQQRYLALQRGRSGAITIRQVMDPAIYDAATGATGWAIAVAVPVLVVAGGMARRMRQQPTND